MSSITLRWKEKNLERTLTESCFAGQDTPVLTKGMIFYYEDKEIKDLRGFYEVDQVELQVVNHGTSWVSNYKVDLKKHK